MFVSQFFYTFIEHVNCHNVILGDYNDVIIDRLQYLCTIKGYTVNKLATRSGLTQSTVENIMSGKTKNPKLKTLHRLAIGLDMTVSELLDFPEMNNTAFEDE